MADTWNKLENLQGTDLVAVLMLVGICLIYPTNGVGANAVAIGFFWVLGRQRSLSRQWWQQAAPLFGAALLMLVVFSAFAFSFRAAIKDTWAVVRGLMVSLPAVYVAQCPPAQLRRSGLVVVAVLAGWALILLGLSLHSDGLLGTYHQQFLYSSAINHNRIGVGLGLGFLLALAWLITAPAIKQRFLYGAAALVLAVAGALNNSRGSLMGTAGGLLLLLFCWNWRYALLLSAGAALAGVALQHFHVLHEVADHNGSLDNGRYAIWSAVMERVHEGPWFGFGLHPMVYDPIIQARHAQAVIPGHTHSIYLDVLYASGVFGCVFWLLWYLLLSVRVHRPYATTSRELHYFGLAALAYMLIHGSVDFVFYGLATPTILTIALAFALVRRGAPGVEAGL